MLYHLAFCKNYIISKAVARLKILYGKTPQFLTMLRKTSTTKNFFFAHFYSFFSKTVFLEFQINFFIFISFWPFEIKLLKKSPYLCKLYFPKILQELNSPSLNLAFQMSSFWDYTILLKFHYHFVWNFWDITICWVCHLVVECQSWLLKGWI